jgi:hypothetical protein
LFFDRELAAKKKVKKDKKKKKIIDNTVPKLSQEKVGSCIPNSPVDSSLNFASVVLPTGMLSFQDSDKVLF